jgi:hypothetical protein
VAVVAAVVVVAAIVVVTATPPMAITAATLPMSQIALILRPSMDLGVPRSVLWADGMYPNFSPLSSGSEDLLPQVPSCLLLVLNYLLRAGTLNRDR